MLVFESQKYYFLMDDSESINMIFVIFRIILTDNKLIKLKVKMITNIFLQYFLKL